MPRVDPDRWRAVSPHLDRALDFASGEERDAWLDALRAEDPALAADVEMLIERMDGLRDARFLDDPAAHLPSMPPLSLPIVDARPGAPIGAYTLVSPIGRGGMGTVWLAERADGRFDRRVAIKFLNLALAGHGEDRFKREGRILARLAHPHIAQLLDAGVTTDGQPYLVLEHVDGEPIDRYCETHGLDVHARLRLFLDVLDAVAHAHASLIVHRDLKPSNVLVTREGRVKLLDFGIAKLLEDDDGGAPTAITIDGAAALTPAYAAPEQVTGQAISTATDVFALGVLLYVLLTGTHPAGARSASPADLLKAIVETDPPRPSEAVARRRAGASASDNVDVAANAASPDAASSDTASPNAASSNAGSWDAVTRPRPTSPEKLRRLLRGDLDTIVGKALKKRPAERFASVTALADDVRRYLRHEPIGARPDSIAYRARKFVRRNRLVVGAAAITIAGLSAGLYVANRERVVAERRFDQVRQLANKLFDIDAAVRNLPGSVAARQLIVNTSLEYLGRLADDARGDPELALEVGTAYMRVARVQGIPISPNLGQLEQADQTLTKAKALIDSVLAARPDNRTAFFRQAQIAHDRMIVAGSRRPDDRALPLARESAAWFDRYLAGGPPEDPAEGRQLVLALNNVGNRFRLANEFDEALRLTRKGRELVRSAPALRSQLGGLLIGMGRIHRDRGAIDDALDAYGEAVDALDPAKGPNREGQLYARSFALALIERAETLAGASRVSAGRTGEAIVLLRRAFAIVDESAHGDANDADSRSLFSTAGRPLAELLRESDAAQSLDVYDHVLRHLGEIENNVQFKRNEVRALAGSSYPLRQLGRDAEARSRLDAAFARLRELKLYPAERIDVGSEPQDALLALAEHHAAQGDARRALEACDDLLRGIAAADTRPDERLRDAAAMSHLYASIANIQRRTTQTGRAAALEARRRELWEAWDRKLPGNPFVMARLYAARED